MKICHVLIASFLLFFVLGLVSGEQSALVKRFLKSRVNTPDEADIDNEEEITNIRKGGFGSTNK